MSRSPSWASGKARQLRTHVTARVSADERRMLAAWTTPAELALFDAQHVADRRHGLDVVAHLRRAGVTDRDVLAAGLLHDCAKGDTGAGPRVAWSLGERLGRWVLAPARLVPGWGSALDRLVSLAAMDGSASSGTLRQPETLPQRSFTTRKSSWFKRLCRSSMRCATGRGSADWLFASVNNKTTVRWPSSARAICRTVRTHVLSERTALNPSPPVISTTTTANTDERTTRRATLVSA